MKYEKHVFICVNQRPEGKDSCGEHTGMQLVNLMKEALRKHNKHIDIRAQKAGCLDVCKFGPAMVVYPEGVFYGKVTEADIEEIVNSHLLNNQPVERLRLSFAKPEE